MTTLREAAQQALDALESADFDPHSSDAIYKAIIALKAALAEPQIWVCPEAADTHRYDKPGHCEDCGNTLVQIK